MAEHDTPGRHHGSPRVNWTAIAVVAAALLAIGAAVYVGIRIGQDERRPADVAGPDRPPVVAGGYPSVAVSIAPAPSPSPTVTPSARPLSPSARPPATSTRPPTSRPSPTRTTAPVFQQRIIESTSVLTTGQSWSTNRLSLTVTAGGNLVLKDQGRTVWQTGTTTGVKLVMQNDGHLVLYDAAGGTAFSSGTAGNPGAVLILRADGNMVIALNGRVLFQTGTAD
jgi:hypothetical protein